MGKCLGHGCPEQAGGWVVVVLAILIFVVTLVFVIWQPRGLSIGWSACGGALLALAAG